MRRALVAALVVGVVTAAIACGNRIDAPAKSVPRDASPIAIADAPPAIVVDAAVAVTPTLPETLAPGTHTVAITVERASVKLAYHVRGKGPPCIAFPGGPGFDSSYLQSEALESAFTTIYVDPFGTGASGALPRKVPYSIARDVAALEQLRVALGLDRICIVGHSYGGFVALRYALAHPTHVSALVLYATAAATDSTWSKAAVANTKWFAAEPWFATAMKSFKAERLARTPAELLASFRGNLPLYFAHWTGNEQRFAAALAGVKPSFDVSYRRTGGGIDVRKRLQTIAVPTLVLVGDRDFLCGIEPGRILAAGIPAATLVTIANAGHYIHVEQPIAFGRAVAEFAATL